MRSWSGFSVRRGIAISAAVLLLAMAPLGAALIVHHQLAGADHDGHQHADFDLCQWVQHHGTSAPALQVLDLGCPLVQSIGKANLSSLLLTGGEPFLHPSPRGPPLS